MQTTIKLADLSATINHKGAELISFKKNTTEHIWEGNPEFWGKHSPVLFPIVGTLKNNSFQFNNTEYSLFRHGFAREMPFDLIEQKENSATFSLKSTMETLRVYPFDFELQITYSLLQDKLDIHYTVINKGTSKMPFSIGAHPAFALTANFEDHSLEFEKEEILECHLLEDGLISNKTIEHRLQNKSIPLTYELFENDALIFKKTESKALTIVKNKKPILRVRFEDFPNLGIWTVANAPFLCIEPWCGYSDTTNSSGDLFAKEGIQVLNPNENFQPKFSIELL